MCAIMVGLLICLSSSAGAELKIDPLMVAATSEVWSLISAAKNPVWPGWNAKDTPILIYLPGVQDVLINHPRPPSEFVEYTGPVRSTAGRIFVRDGKTMINWDGQNTSREVYSVRTLIVADTLSNLRQNVAALLQDTRPVEEKVRDLSFEQLSTNAYDTLTTVAHEAFHVYQDRMAPDKGGNELALVKYPALSVDNNVGFALEGAALADALRATDVTAAKNAAVRWLAIRQHRRQGLSAEATAYEDGTEFNEGLAKYVEYRLLEALQGQAPAEAMTMLQGFHGYADLSAERARLVDQMLGYMRGDKNVNNDLYGASPVRMRLYYSGMGIAALLDRLTTGWHERILQPKTTLTELATQAIGAEPADLSKALAQARTGEAYTELMHNKSTLQREGRNYATQIAEQIEKSAHGSLVVDYAALGKPHVSLGFTPFGILGVDDNRVVYRLAPLSAQIGSAVIEQTQATGALHDQGSKRLVFPLTGPLDASSKPLSDLLASREPQSLGTLTLPGVQLQGAFGKIRRMDNQILVELTPR